MTNREVLVFVGHFFYNVTLAKIVSNLSQRELLQFRDVNIQRFAVPRWSGQVRSSPPRSVTSGTKDGTSRSLGSCATPSPCGTQLKHHTRSVRFFFTLGEKRYIINRFTRALYLRNSYIKPQERAILRRVVLQAPDQEVVRQRRQTNPEIMFSKFCSNRTATSQILKI